MPKTSASAPPLLSALYARTILALRLSPATILSELADTERRAAKRASKCSHTPVNDRANAATHMTAPRLAHTAITLRSAIK